MRVGPTASYLPLAATALPAACRDSASRAAAATALRARTIRAAMTTIGSHALQGERSYMEDRVVACTVEGGLFAGVFDGHSGDAAAEFCAKALVAAFSAATPLLGEGQYEQALSAAFSATNEAFLVGPTADDSGCTACCVLLVNGVLYVANCGDSRAVLLGADAAPLQLSVDHKPDDEQEYERVEAAGGSVFDAEDGNGARVVGPKVDNGVKI